jgi:hypothetical protein
LYQCHHDKKYSFATKQESITMTLALLAKTLETIMIGLPTQLPLFHFKVWGFPQPAINILLKTMETMRFYLCTGFCKSKTSYGGTHELQGMVKVMWLQVQDSQP